MTIAAPLVVLLSITAAALADPATSSPPDPRRMPTEAGDHISTERFLGAGDGRAPTLDSLLSSDARAGREIATARPGRPRSWQSSFARIVRLR